MQTRTVNMMRNELSDAELDQQLLDCADDRGLIHCGGDTIRDRCLRLVRDGRLVEISRYKFSLPEGG